MTAVDERRTALLRAAREAIESLGPGVGMAQIAERAGIPRPNVYRTFSSKDELDAAVAREASKELLGLIRPPLSRAGTALEVIRGVIAPQFSWAAQHPHLYRFIAAQQQTRALHRSRTGRSQFLTEVVARMSRYFEVPDDKVGAAPEGVLAGLMGMIDASTLWWLDHRDETEEQVVDRLARQVELILSELLATLGVVVPADAVFETA